MCIIGKTIETESRSVVARGWRSGGNGNDHLMGTGFIFGVMKMSWNLIVVVVA